MTGLRHVPSLCDACREARAGLERFDRKPRAWSVPCWTGVHAECVVVVQVACGCLCPCHVRVESD